jgi:lipid A 3-O-deacylase
MHLCDTRESEAGRGVMIEILQKKTCGPKRGRHSIIQSCLIWVLVLMVFVAMILPANAHDWFIDDPPLISLSIGAAEVFDSHQELFGCIEYRPAIRFFHVGPWMSLGTGRNHEIYAAIGVLLNIEIGHGWVLTPSFGAGYYNASSGLDLGFDAEFRSGIELTRHLPNGHRLGLSFSHLSNGSLGEKNPGTETFGIVYLFSLGAVDKGSERVTPCPLSPLAPSCPKRVPVL